ncbi:MAG: acylneuraminate cytidylyltransferase family protein [Clostridiaceae bacterium]|nr:acylneuraminate cytidylyltransferase family protein [Clostridiaceae bacterium]
MINNNKILAIIPARGGSKGLPRKNIKNLNGKPLIAYTIEAAKKSKYIDRIIVSTEDEEIEQVSKNFGAEVPYLRPQEMAQDTSSVVDSIIHMINWLKGKEDYKPDYICLLQCTSPLRNYEDIDGAIEKLFKTNMDGVVSVCEVEVNPYWTNVFEGNRLKYFLEQGKSIIRRQDLPKIYRLNGAIYVIRTDVFLREKTFETDDMTGYIMLNKNSVDIDTLIDFKFAELLLKDSENYA